MKTGSNMNTIGGGGSGGNISGITTRAMLTTTINIVDFNPNTTNIYINSNISTCSCTYTCTINKYNNKCYIVSDSAQPATMPAG